MMDSLDIFQSRCRICLEKPAVLDWNEAIPEFGDTTYKCCYFIYTQLVDDNQDVFSQMLCETCATDLRNTHLLIRKAQESNTILQQTLQINTEVDKDMHNQVLDTIDFETVFYKQSIESLIDEQNLTLSMDESSNEEIVESKTLKKEHVDQKAIVENHNDDILYPDDLEIEPVDIPQKKEHVDQKAIVENHNDILYPDDLEIELVDDISQSTENLNVVPKPKQDDTTKIKKIYKKIIKMCRYCSKLLRAEHLKSHEETHQADRERTLMCPECGLKFFRKSTLDSHMLTHIKYREKKYKCEFCEKSYFNRGGLTVHQRIHLGQMISCPICSKQYYRQVDLDKHNVLTHSAQSVLNTNYEKNKYFVECKDCGKTMPSHKWKPHHDTHLKNFQMKCILCDKHFINKTTCHKHVKKVHKTDKKDYAKVVSYYGENVGTRISHLMIKQTHQFKTIDPVPENM